MFLCPTWLNIRLSCLFCFCLLIPAFLHRGLKAVSTNKIKTTGGKESRGQRNSVMVGWVSMRNIY